LSKIIVSQTLLFRNRRRIIVFASQLGSNWFIKKSGETGSVKL